MENMQFDFLLSRADDETLQQLLGENPLRLLMLLDPGLATPTRLRELIVGLNSPEGLLRAKKSRHILCDLLPYVIAYKLSYFVSCQARNWLQFTYEKNRQQIQKYRPAHTSHSGR